MDKEFDKYVEDYIKLHEESTKSSGFKVDYFDRNKIEKIYLDTPINNRLKPLKILNFGCGIGNCEPLFKEYFPNSFIYGIDVSKKSIEYATNKNKHLTNTFYSLYDGQTIPFDVKKFDIILAANVFHHIPFGEHNVCFQLIFNSLADNGRFYIFEHNPYNPLTRKVVNDCKFDENAVLLNPIYTKQKLKEAGFKHLTLKFTLFFPKIVSFLIPIEKYISFLPLGAQYFYKAKK